MDNFTLTRWDKTDYEALTAHLLSMKDPAYKDFHQKLIPDVYKRQALSCPLSFCKKYRTKSL